MSDYTSLSREKLIENCDAYSKGMHEINERCQVLMVQIFVLRKKLKDNNIADPTEEKLSVVPVICEGLGEVA